MTLRNVRWLFICSAATLLLAGGCFLVVGEIPEGSENGAGGDASANGGTSGSGGISGNSGNAGAAVGGSAGTAGAGASAGDGGVGGSAGVSGSGGAGGSAGGTCIKPPCDCDNDGFDSVLCAQGDDCDDTDFFARPGQMGWFSEKRNDGTGFDYNCDSKEDREFVEVTCNGLNSLLCGQQPIGFHAPAQPCGQPGSYGKCKYQGISCVPDVTSPDKIVRCH